MKGYKYTKMQTCANQEYAPEYAQMFEELGKCTNRPKIKEFAKEIFVEKNYGWLIETFKLHLHRTKEKAKDKKTIDNIFSDFCNQLYEI